MKILKIRVRADVKGKMLYPLGFLNIQCLEYLYCDDLKTGICWLVVLIEDKDFDVITDKIDVEELNKTDAETFVNEYEPKVTEITDEVRIRAIEIKTKANIPLSVEDLKALDPNDNTPGIQYKKRFIDKVKIRLGL